MACPSILSDNVSRLRVPACADCRGCCLVILGIHSSALRLPPESNGSHEQFIRSQSGEGSADGGQRAGPQRRFTRFAPSTTATARTGARRPQAGQLLSAPPRRSPRGCAARVSRPGDRRVATIAKSRGPRRCSSGVFGGEDVAFEASTTSLTCTLPSSRGATTNDTADSTYGRFD